MLILVFLAFNKTALDYNNNDNFIYPAKIDQLNLNIKTAGINLCAVDKIFQISVYLAIKKNYENDKKVRFGCHSNSSIIYLYV